MSFSPHVIQFEPPISYNEALFRIEQVAESFEVNARRSIPAVNHENSSCNAAGISKVGSEMLLAEAVGSTSYYTLYAPHSTPQYDTSAMDGFAVNANSTNAASMDSPVRLRVIDSIAAGDEPFRVSVSCRDDGSLQASCTEIMTGACFPVSLSYLDSVVKIEDVTLEEERSNDGNIISRFVILTQPIVRFQHRRPAGSDFKQGDTVIKRGTVIEPKHVAALASLGHTHIQTMTNIRSSGPDIKRTETKPTLRVGIISTGTEIVEANRASECSSKTSTQQRVQDSNGPYLVSGLRSACPWVHVEYLGVVQDDEEELTSTLRKAILEQPFDVIITSGGVSKGRHDLVRYVVEEKLGGHVVFHGAKVRPGAPILFVSFDESEGLTPERCRSHTAFFGAPGNPLAAAVALRFFVIPFVMCLRVKQLNNRSRSSPSNMQIGEKPVFAPVQKWNKESWVRVSSMRHKLGDRTVFWLAKQREGEEDSIEIVDDQASYKLRGLLEAEFWAIIPSSQGKSSCEVGYLLSPL